MKEPVWSEIILQGMPQLAYIFDREGRMLRWNKNLETTLGYTEDELYNKFVLDFIAEPFREKVFEEVTKMFEERDSRTVEYEMLLKSGKRIPFLGSGSYANVNGKEYMIGQAVDISHLKEVEAKLKVHIEMINELKEKLESENTYLKEEIKVTHKFDEIIGESPALMHSLYRLDQVASLETTVLLEGETGTGKELFARAIHEKSDRKGKPFIKVNCAALPASLIESELFGHEKGAYTGAVQSQAGRFELAHTGTIFLDEIGELPLELQSKILRVLQEGEFEKVGNPKTMKVDIRVIAATNRNLTQMTEKGTFRKDLFYRLSVFPITIPPLRDRVSDIALLAEYFLSRFNGKFGRKISRIPKRVIREMERYNWPGNIRELENVIERSLILSPGSELVLEGLNVSNKSASSKMLPLKEYEKRYITEVLTRTHWRVSGEQGAAKILDMHPETLRSRMRKLGLERPVAQD